ncbi:GNAT domain-containing protein [Desulfonema limicola]|uniref:GNAT domain-containing protein n=1 Tax=Desulfonema limicola TaxID=45656 RepID=A0A975BCF0_9BACT|nr:GNAT family N-acetyltransferase [Desulfonema limicola]QTA82778.1 GNAT domain-containing protein [Desulfonema limicola]
MKQPTFNTDRLTLRPFSRDDAENVQRLAGRKQIASKTIPIPHPYELHMAYEWIGTHNQLFEKGEVVNFAVTHRLEKYLVGCVGLNINKKYEMAELGYWIGIEYWGNGYCTEASKKVLEYGFETLNLNRIFAYHFGSNPASGRVMEKIGMKYEGFLRQAIKKWGKFEDSVVYGVLKSDLN